MDGADIVYMDSIIIGFFYLFLWRYQSQSLTLFFYLTQLLNNSISLCLLSIFSSSCFVLSSVLSLFCGSISRFCFHFVYQTICLISTCLSVLPIYLSVCLYVCLSVCLSRSLSLYRLLFPLSLLIPLFSRSCRLLRPNNTLPLSTLIKMLYHLYNTKYIKKKQ